MTGNYPSFFQFTDRMFEGKRTHPWEGGQYGFVRNQKATPAGVLFTRFHEGLDIKPLFRTSSGEPLDTVRAIDAGLVVYVNDNPRGSSYGKYVVVEHLWSGMPFYSLYAHLGSIRVGEGQRVRQGQSLGRIGYTGRGIDRRRAHVHFEINLMLNQGFKKWHESYFRNNPHGLYNGVNLTGINVAELYVALHRNPSLTIEEFLRSQEAYYRVRVPNEGALDVHFRYPWLSEYGYDPAAPSLEISFAQSGLPLKIEPAYDPVTEPIVVWSQLTNAPFEYVSNGILSGRHVPVLTSSGRRFLRLLTTDARHPTDTVMLAGRSLRPPEPDYPPVRKMQPARPDTAVRKAALAGASQDRDTVRGEIPVDPNENVESSGGEVRGW